MDDLTRFELAKNLFKINIIKENTFTTRELEIRNIATNLFLSYHDENEMDECLLGPGWGSLSIRDFYIDVADKIYESSGSLERSQIIINFIKGLKPSLAKQIINAI